MSGPARLPVVDAHQHFWDPRRNRIPWLTAPLAIGFRYGDYARLRRPYLPPDYLADAAGFDVAKTVYVETEWDPDDPLGEVAWVGEVAAAHGYPHAVVAAAWLDRDDVEAVLAAYAASALVRGVRNKPSVAHSPYAPAPGPQGSMSDARWRRGYALLERHRLSFDLQVPYWHLAEAARLAADFPAVPMIVDHTGVPPADRSEPGLAAWRAGMAALAALPHVAVKISGLGQAATPWTVAGNRRVVRETIDLFGVERCMFASNFPVDGLVADFATVFDGFAEIVADLPEADRRKLFHDNAVRWYRL